MVHQRYCGSCGQEVRCTEERHQIVDTPKSMIRLLCPRCGRQLASVYDDELAISKTRRF
jgi:predicted RNA-binding Zn-ribbon protein involved in translation (DUF1610 family)